MASKGKNSISVEDVFSTLDDLQKEAVCAVVELSVEDNLKAFIKWYENADNYTIYDGTLYERYKDPSGFEINEPVDIDSSFINRIKGGNDV